MRDPLRLCIGLTFAALAMVPATAAPRDPMHRDGKFTICQFQDFDRCQMLTDRALRRFKLSTKERHVLSELERFTSASHVPLATLEKAFGPASKIFPHDALNDKTVVWFTNSVGLNDLKAKCPECGIYLRQTGDTVVSVNYIVDRKFTIVWFRAETPVRAAQAARG